MVKDRGKWKSRKGLVAMQKAKNIKNAVKFVRTYLQEGVDEIEVVRIASKFYHVGIAEIRDGLTKAASTSLQMTSRIWGPEELAHYFGFTVHWVYKITKKNSADPPPRCEGLGRLRFDTDSQDFQDWMARQTTGSRLEGATETTPIDSQGN